MDTLYRVCPQCKGTGDQIDRDGPPCQYCMGAGYVPAYTSVDAQGHMGAAIPANRAAPPPNFTNPPQQYPQQQSYQPNPQAYQQQAQNYNPSGPSERQMQFLEDLIKRNGMSPDDGDRLAEQMFGVKVPGLTKLQASKMIEDLQARAAAAKATASAAGAPPF